MYVNENQVWECENIMSILCLTENSNKTTYVETGYFVLFSLKYAHFEFDTSVGSSKKSWDMFTNVLFHLLCI